MNFKELFEGVEPKMPGAPSGIQIMTPQQFVARSNAGEEPEPKEVDEEGVAEGSLNELSSGLLQRAAQLAKNKRNQAMEPELHNALGGGYMNPLATHYDDVSQKINNRAAQVGKKETIQKIASKIASPAVMRKIGMSGVAEAKADPTGSWVVYNGSKVIKFKTHSGAKAYAEKNGGQVASSEYYHDKIQKQGVAEGLEQLDRIRGLSGLGEATKLPAPQRTISEPELTDYMDRIRGIPDIDKKTGLPKKTKDTVSKKGVVKPGKDKVISLKTKQDMFRMPYIHRASVMRYYSPEGKVYDTDMMKTEIKKRPEKLLKQNEKMKHSNGQLEQFFNIGFAALVGAAVDESTNEVIIVNTCPGAGACMVDCFEMKGGFIQYEAGWLSRSRILTYLLNDPEGFTSQINAEIAQEAVEGKAGGYSVSIRWHNSGDFFSPEYLKLAFDIANANPTVKFYAYTKMAGAALAKKPPNFIINWSEGANTAQTKQVKANDPTLSTTKNSRIVPEKLFWDLLKKDEKGNLDKEGADEDGKGGRWVTRDQQATQELKQRLAQAYKLSANSILDYDEYMAKRNSIPAGMKYNVIVAPGEGDISANDPAVLSTLLLRH
jgi:hypothetical protein